MQHLAGAPKTKAREKQLKAAISILIVGKVKCRPKNTKQNQEGLIHAEDQISQEAFIDLNTNQITIQQQLVQQKLWQVH